MVFVKEDSSRHSDKHYNKDSTFYHPRRSTATEGSIIFLNNAKIDSSLRSE